MLTSKSRSRRALYSSALFDETTFHRAFARDLYRARKGVVIESPYLTKRRSLCYAQIFEDLIKRGVSIRINTRKPIYHSGDMKSQSEEIIGILKDIGLKVYAYDDLRHRKLAMIDNSILWEGSLNILSHSNSREIMRRTSSRKLCCQMIAFAGVHN